MKIATLQYWYNGRKLDGLGFGTCKTDPIWLAIKSLLWNRGDSLVGNPIYTIQNILKNVVHKTNEQSFYPSKLRFENQILDLLLVIIDHNHQ